MGKSQAKYMELVSFIREQIACERFLPGQKIYSENELKDMFHMSRQTVRHAISVLEEEGVLRRIRGSGTYINDKGQADMEKRTRVSVVTTYVDGYIFPRTIQGIESILFENGYTVQIAFTNNQNSRERTILEDILSRDEVAGVIMETTKSGIPNPNLHLYMELQKKGIPVIFINSSYPLLPIPHVSLNDKMAGNILTEHMLEMGHRNIGGIFKLDDGQGHMRYAGYLEAMQKAGAEIDDAHILWIDTESIRNLHKIKDLMLDRLKDCSAVICYNDQVAFELIEMAKKEGIRVPEDLSVAAIDDSELAVLGEVAFTSVPHPMDKLGKKAAKNLLKLINSPSFDANYEFDAGIVYRDSVKKMLGA